MNLLERLLLLLLQAQDIKNILAGSRAQRRIQWVKAIKRRKRKKYDDELLHHRGGASP